MDTDHPTIRGILAEYPELAISAPWCAVARARHDRFIPRNTDGSVTLENLVAAMDGKEAVVTVAPSGGPGGACWQGVQDGCKAGNRSIPP